MFTTSVCCLKTKSIQITMTGLKAWALLLLPFSLVSMGKADCPFPVLNGKIVLSSESILKNSFPDNSEAFVECAKGYERDEGPTSITCVNGVWSPVQLICKKKDCGLPSPSSHMTYIIPDGTLFGAYIQPKCETGYDLEGSSHRQCLVSGWSGRSECILTVCILPDEIEHGSRVSPEEPVFNDVIRYSCNDDYILVGNSSIICGEYGEYSSPPPICKAIECPDFEVKFGKRTEGNPPFFHKSKATFECWPGYRMKGLATSVCEKSGWSALPVCDEVIITPTKASTTTNKATTTASTHSNGGLQEGLTVFLGVLVVSVVCCCCVCCLCFVCYYSKRKGSYNTGEELRAKEELLLNQSV